MTDRYYVQPPISGETAKLAGQEAHHLTHVMRASPGSRVILFDGSGIEFSAQVERITRTEVHLAILSRADVDRESSPHLTLGAPLPKGDRQRWLVEKSVELGVGRFVPLATARSVARFAIRRSLTVGLLRGRDLGLAFAPRGHRMRRCAKHLGGTDHVHDAIGDVRCLFQHGLFALRMSRQSPGITTSALFAS
ncbi:MAG: 16S rRNA (uracil(1498)-N(3))-methyltransferase, partial [Planctomycetes bacterium]|nr:16S rRNA (uracil(1498)-N(3))-methyltransferase [Planctomycetota bacterium]